VKRALKEARNKEYGVIVLDRMLPGMSGLELVKALRNEARMTPVIYLTTMGGIDEPGGRDWRAGGDDYLVKPFAFEELLARVRVAPDGLPTLRRACSPVPSKWISCIGAWPGKGGRSTCCRRSSACSNT